MNQLHHNTPEYRAASHVTWLSVVMNLLLGAAKVAAGYWGQSRALVADGLHSIGDVASDVGVLLGIAVASRPPDSTHPYGHHKAATLVTLGIAVMLLVFCIGLLYESARMIITAEAVVPHWPTLAVAIGSLLVKEWLYRRTRRIARETHSTMLLANAWHHRTDSVTSVIAAAGILAAILLGEAWAFLDSVIGLLLAGYIGITSARLLIDAIKDLMDTAPEASVIDDLREHILPTPGTIGYHDFRARRVGDMIEVDFHLVVPSDMSVKEGHDVAARVKREILSRHPEVINVLIHIEPDLPEHQHERGVAELSDEAGSGLV